MASDWSVLTMEVALSMSLAGTLSKIPFPWSNLCSVAHLHLNPSSFLKLTT